MEAVSPYTASQGPEVDVLWDQISKGESIMVVEKRRKLDSRTCSRLLNIGINI